MKTICYRNIRIDITYRSNAVRLTLNHRAGEQRFTLTAPTGCSDRVIRGFLDQHADWLASELQLKASPMKDVIPNGPMTYQGYRIQVTQRASAKRIILHHRAHEDFFTLTTPVGCPRQEVMKLLESNAEWMRKAMAKEHILDWQPVFAAGEQHWVLGQLVTLGQNGVPCGERAFVRYRTEQLKQLLMQELERWQRIMGVRITSVTLRSMRSKWGSCRPSTGALTFASELGYYPPCCVTEVVVHELNHMRHPDHSKAFYADLARYDPDWKQAHELKKTFDITPRRPVR